MLFLHLNIALIHHTQWNINIFNKNWKGRYSYWPIVVALRYIIIDYNYKTSYNYNNKPNLVRNEHTDNIGLECVFLCALTRFWIIQQLLFVTCTKQYNPIALPLDYDDCTRTCCLLFYFILFFSLLENAISTLEIQPIFMRTEVVTNCKFDSYKLFYVQCSICPYSKFFLF